MTFFFIYLNVFVYLYLAFCVLPFTPGVFGPHCSSLKLYISRLSLRLLLTIVFENTEWVFKYDLLFQLYEYAVFSFSEFIIHVFKVTFKTLTAAFYHCMGKEFSTSDKKGAVRNGAVSVLHNFKNFTGIFPFNRVAK